MAGAAHLYALKGSPFKPGQLTVQQKTPLFAKCSKRQQQGNCRTATFLGKKTKTTTSLAVMKRTARQGEHWNNEELSSPKSTRSPARGELPQLVTAKPCEDGTAATATFWGITKESKTYELHDF